MSFVCSVCGEHHDAELRDIRMGLPHEVHALAEDERAARVWQADDFAVLDDRRFYVRGLLEIPIPEAGDRFGYGTWVEVSVEAFRQLIATWHASEQFTPVPCVLANELSPYEDTLLLEATLLPVSPTKLPLVELDDADHPLVRDQRSGISVERSRELASVVAHTV